MKIPALDATFRGEARRPLWHGLVELAAAGGALLLRLGVGLLAALARLARARLGQDLL